MIKKSKASLSYHDVVMNIWFKGGGLRKVVRGKRNFMGIALQRRAKILYGSKLLRLPIMLASEKQYSASVRNTVNKQIWCSRLGAWKILHSPSHDVTVRRRTLFGNKRHQYDVTRSSFCASSTRRSPGGPEYTCLYTATDTFPLRYYAEWWPTQHD